MFFPNMQLTEAGKSLIVKALAGETLTFTKLALGCGSEPADRASLTALVNPVISFAINTIEQGEGCVALNGSFSNATLDEGFDATELGVFADDPDAGEILYAYSHAGDHPSYIAESSSSSSETIKFSVVVAVGDAEHVTAIIGDAVGFATQADFLNHSTNKNNPHEVTKAQVGLGNVPNVSTNNQTPTYSGMSGVSPLVSGETLRVAFAKIKTAIDAFILHRTQANPHNITPSKIGAASSTHIHSANDITAGILPATRGGTGASSINELSKLVGQAFIKEGNTTSMDDTGVNSIKTPGYYILTGSPTNGPGPGSFHLLVLKMSSTDTTQIAIVPALYQGNYNRVYIRDFLHPFQEWTAWTPIF